MPSSRLAGSCEAFSTSASVMDLSVPATRKTPSPNSMSAAAVSMTLAAIFLPFSMIWRPP